MLLAPAASFVLKHVHAPLYVEEADLVLPVTELLLFFAVFILVRILEMVVVVA